MLDCKPSGKNCKVTKINPQCPLHLTFSPAWDGTRERGKNSDKNRLTILNHMSYNNLTFESDRKTLRHDSYRRGRLGIQEMPMYNGFRGSRGKSIGIQRTFRCLSTGANYTTKAAIAGHGHFLFTVLPGWWTQRPMLVRIQLLSAR